ncbi:MAG: UbiD family decarboxylase, partial [Sulfolobaceae archaeon]
MAFRDLRDYIIYMKEKGKIIEIEEEVSVDLEIAEITRKACYNKLPPLLFKNIKEYKNWKIISNIFYSLDGIYEIFNTNNLESITSNFLDILSDIPITFLDKIRSFKDALKLGKFFPTSKKPRFVEREDIKILDLPAIKTWPKDAGRYFTFSITITKDPDTEV